MQPDDGTTLQRRALLRGAAGLGLLGLGGCATAAPGPMAGGLAFYDRVPPLAPLRVHADRLFKITVCLRPFRAQGPRMDVETVGDKTVVHNYGHGGSGWSLSWGSGQIAVGKALASGERDIAVVGCGALGLTAAIVAQRAGASVTIYAKDIMPDVRSARATGTWSPDSRIALESAAGPQFPALWEQMARTSFRTYQDFLGLPGTPVAWSDRYNVSRLSPEATKALHRGEPPGFVNYSSRIADLTPRPQLLPPGSHPFPEPYVQRNSSMQFNIHDYAHTLLADFRAAGGQIVTREFHSPADYASIKQKVLINSTGYGSRALWKDDSIIPVRGQIAWLIPQPEVNYGLYYNGVSMLSRPDGIVIQQTGTTEAWGYNDDNETPDRAEAETALGVFAELYSRMRG